VRWKCECTFIFILVVQCEWTFIIMVDWIAHGSDCVT